MALQGAIPVKIGDGVVGADGFVYSIRWDVLGIDLTDATAILGTRRNLTNDEITPLVGTLTATSANTIGWALNSGDVLEEGLFEVQFTAEVDGKLFRNVPSRWQVWAGNEANQPPPPPDPPLGIVTFIRVNADGTYSFLEAADFRTAIGVSATGEDIPIIAPATAGNIPLILADGTLEDGGVSPASFDPAGSAAAVGDAFLDHATDNTIHFTQAEISITPAQAGADPAGSAAAAAAASIPKIDPAVAGDLVVQAADGTLVGAGYAADVNATAGSVVRRTVNNKIILTSDTPLGDAVIQVSATSATPTQAIQAISQTGSGMISTSTTGAYHHEFGNVSAIARTTGALTFLGASATANRLAQTNEIEAVSWGGAQTLTAGEQTQARANIGAETSGAAAAVQSNLTAHTGNSTIHFTQADISITPAQAGAAAAVHTHTASQISDSGTTGRALVQAETQGAARGVLGLAPIAQEPLVRQHNTMTFATSNVVGSFTATTFLASVFLLASGTTANSQGSYRLADQAIPITNYAGAGVDFSRRLFFSSLVRVSVANTEGVLRCLVGKSQVEAYGNIASGNYVGWEVTNGTITSLIHCKAGTLVTIAVSVALGAGGQVQIDSNNGTISWYANGVLIGSTGVGPVGLGNSIFYELNNGATAANYSVVVTSQSRGH
jgi:hypothetical protein